MAMTADIPALLIVEETTNGTVETWIHPDDEITRPWPTPTDGEILGERAELARLEQAEFDRLEREIPSSERPTKSMRPLTLEAPGG
jgi:hypothetical protein